MPNLIMVETPHYHPRRCMSANARVHYTCIVWFWKFRTHPLAQPVKTVPHGALAVPYMTATGTASCVYGVLCLICVWKSVCVVARAWLIVMLSLRYVVWLWLSGRVWLCVMVCVIVRDCV